MTQDQFALPAALDRAAPEPLRLQLERGLRAAIRAGRLHPGTRLPSSRALAAQLGLSRGVVVEAYGQLVAEGYLGARQGQGTRVAAGAAATAAGDRPRRPRPAPAYDLSLGRPDLAAFPRADWLAATRRVLGRTPDADLGHPDPRGADVLRTELASYLGRVRGVAASSERVLVVNGFFQGLALLCAVLAARGVRRLAVEDPGFALHRRQVQHAGLEPVPVPVDESGLVVDRLAGTGADAVLVTPAHQFPTGVVLAPERRTALLNWADRTGGLVIEDDYDAEYRYDRGPVGALQGLAPEHVVYGGTASKTLTPALRLGWLAVPEALARPLALEKGLADAGSGTLDQLVFADLLAAGRVDRHLRRTRRVYGRRRIALVEAVARDLPGARVSGVAAGLHAVLELPPGAPAEAAIVRAAGRRGVRVEAMGEHRVLAAAAAPALLLGYAGLPEPALGRAMRELARAVAEASRA